MRTAGAANRAILLVDHGSRRPEANAVLDAIAGELRTRAPGTPIEVAHLDLAPPSLEEGILACVRAGADEIVVHPYFLAPGMHTSRDIPERVRAAAALHGIHIVVTEPLGFHRKLVDVVLERIEHS